MTRPSRRRTWERPRGNRSSLIKPEGFNSMVIKRTSVPDLYQMKARGDKIVLLTAYDCMFAGLIDDAGVDIILVGDSLGMVVMGYENTVPVTMEQVIHHTQAVANAARHAMLIADMPFGSYEASDEEAVHNAQRLVKEGGAQAVKAEGGNELIRQRIAAIVKAGVPVMGHLGLTPQTASLTGGYRVQGREAGAARQIVSQARGLQEAGAFSVLFECIPVELAGLIRAGIDVLTIGIGAGTDYDGQALVIHDLLGLTATTPRHASRYCNLREIVGDALARYRADVKEGRFPGADNVFHMPGAEIDKLKE
jgi:3-methyl-2-oxobutanoate hydroxymethyltransferase